MFASQLKGKTVMTRDGQILGTLTELLVDTRTGRILNLLVAPADDLEVRLFETDAKRRIVLPFTSLQHVKDVVVVEHPGP